MIARGTALALAFLLLATGLSAAPGACCPSDGRAEHAIAAVDCCATMLECPTAPQAVLTTAARGAENLPAAHALPVSPALFAQGSPRLTAARAFLEPPPDGPRLYRLHSQLLI